VITARRVVITIVLGAALFLFVLAFTWKGDAADTPTLTERAVERLLPADGSPGVLRQSTIEADLAAGWTGVLQVNGVELGPDQLNCLDDCELPPCAPAANTPPGLGTGESEGERRCRSATDPQNRVYFVPGPGKQIEQLPTGETCATAVIWRTSASRADSRDVTWCFRVTA
jgi:hypothetical protein